MIHIKNDIIDIALIDIPHTEYPHVENYIRNKFNTDNYTQNLKHHKSTDVFNGNTYIITVVKNPYSRIIKYLLQLHKIDNVSKNNTYNLIQNIIDTGEIQPQYKFIANKNEEVHKEIHVLHSELLEYEMYLMGHRDFYLNENMNDHINYFDYIDSDTIQLINKYFSKDFDLLGYPKHSVK